LHIHEALLFATEKPLAGLYPNGSRDSAVGELITHITIPVGRERRALMFAPSPHHRGTRQAGIFAAERGDGREAHTGEMTARRERAAVRWQHPGTRSIGHL